MPLSSLPIAVLASLCVSSCLAAPRFPPRSNATASDYSDSSSGNNVTALSQPLPQDKFNTELRWGATNARVFYFEAADLWHDAKLAEIYVEFAPAGQAAAAVQNMFALSLQFWQPLKPTVTEAVQNPVYKKIFTPVPAAATAAFGWNLVGFAMSSTFTEAIVGWYDLDLKETYQTVSNAGFGKVWDYVSIGMVKTDANRDEVELQWHFARNEGAPQRTSRDPDSRTEAHCVYRQQARETKCVYGPLPGVPARTSPGTMLQPSDDNFNATMVA